MKDESNIIRDEKQLTEAFASAGANHGFNKVRADFSAFQDFKVKWTRNYEWAEFRVTDYLREAPREVVLDVADVIFRKIRGNVADYSASTVEYLTSDGFLNATRGVYLKRLEGFTASYVGEKHPLGECVERLIDRGLVEEDPKLVIGWVEVTGHAAGRVSTLMRVAAVNSRLAADYTDEDLLDFVVYALLSRVRVGFPTTIHDATRDYQCALDRYPGRDDLERRLSEAGFNLRKWASTSLENVVKLEGPSPSGTGRCWDTTV